MVIVLIACSVLVFLQARRRGRNPLFWLVLLWMSCITCITIGAIVFALSSFSGLSSPPRYSAYIVMIVGALPVLIAVNRNPTDKSKQRSKD
jgi:hypothetical protein